MDSTYFPLAPTPDVALKQIISGPSELTKEQLDLMCSVGDSLPVEPAGQSGAEYRSFEHSRMGLTDATRPIFEAVGQLVRKINARFMHFDLSAFAEPFLYNTYREGHSAPWHIDEHPPGGAVRKLSLSILLSDPSEYDGGEFESCTGEDVVRYPKHRGTVIAFPSYVLHRVTPVTRGVRQALIVLVTGPSFR